MASRAQQKEEARQARLEAEQAAAAKSAQQRRLGAIAGVVIVAIVVVVVAIAVSSGGGKQGGLARPGKAQQAVVSAVNAELAGLPQSGTTIGNPNAKVTIQYFGDLECPICAEFSTGQNGGGFPQLLQGPVKAGQVKVVYRSLETASGSTNNDRFVPQQVAAYAAGKQGKFWQYAELFYHEQGSETTRYVTEDYLQGIARQIPGLNFAKWMQDRRDPALLAQVQADSQAASKDGLNATPQLVAIGPKTEQIIPSSVGYYPYSDVQAGIKAVL